MNDAKHKPITSEQREKQRSLAFAALTQVAYLVESIAQEGKCESTHFKTSIQALLDDNYLADREFSLGRIKAKQLLQGLEIKHVKHMIAHTSTLIAIEKKLVSKPKVLATIAQGMSRIHKQNQYFGDPCHENIISALAHLYGETISTINPRVIVRGKPEHLKQKHHTEQVRCLLFSGVRAAWVWRTNGGHSMRLFFGRKDIIKQLDNFGKDT